MTSKIQQIVQGGLLRLLVRNNRIAAHQNAPPTRQPTPPPRSGGTPSACPRQPAKCAAQFRNPRPTSPRSPSGLASTVRRLDCSRPAYGIVPAGRHAGRRRPTASVALAAVSRGRLRKANGGLVSDRQATRPFRRLTWKESGHDRGPSTASAPMRSSARD